MDLLQQEGTPRYMGPPLANHKQWLTMRTQSEIVQNIRRSTSIKDHIQTQHQQQLSIFHQISIKAEETKCCDKRRTFLQPWAAMTSNRVIVPIILLL